MIESSPMNSSKNTAIGCKWRNTLIGMIVLLWPVCALAQVRGTTDVVYLKNGSIVHGSLFPAKDSNHIALRTGNNDVWVFPRSEIMKTGREKTVLPITKQGWYNTTNVGLFFGDDKGYQLQTIVGYRFFSRYYAGLGVALDDYKFRAVPVFANLQVDILLKKVTPFVYADIGIANPWPLSNLLIYGRKPDKKNAGIYFSAGIGQRFHTGKNNHSFQLSLGYSLEKFRFIFPQKGMGAPGNDTEVMRTDIYRYTFNRLVIQAGFTL